MQRSPQGRKPAPEGEDVLGRVLEWLRTYTGRYGPYVLGAAVALIVALFVHQGYKNKARKEQTDVWQELWQMPPLSRSWQRASDEELKEVISSCEKILSTRWETDATPWVLLKLANAQRTAGALEDALRTYERIRREYPEHYVVKLTAPNVGAVHEELGHYREAALAYENLAQREGKGSHLWLDAGRSWELAAERQSATGAYRKFLEGREDESGEELEMAAERVEALQAGESLLAPPPPPPPPAPAEEETGAGEEEAPEDAAAHATQPYGPGAQAPPEPEAPGDGDGVGPEKPPVAPEGG